MFIRYLQNFYNGNRLKQPINTIRNWCRNSFYIVVCVLILSASNYQMHKIPEKVRQFTHTIEFDYVDWTLNAVVQKIKQSAISLEDYLPRSLPTSFVKNYLRAQSEISRLKTQISVIYANPEIQDKPAAIHPIQMELDRYQEYKDRLAPYAESTLQKQINTILAEKNLALLGQSLPPVLYHSTPLPMALIVSPRQKIQQDANISLSTEMTSGDMTALEDSVMANLDVSALVVPVGGVGVYPTMVMATSDLAYLTDTIAHEWTHNFLTLRPLGINYETTSELRTINETTASIVGAEVGELVIRRYYPELVPPEPEQVDIDMDESNAISPEIVPFENEPDLFNYRKEMHTTRIHVDEILAAGKIEEAENYMEEQRKMFWENGYPIRRLNQAYFAFYGAYADTPGGAAGEDPIGPLVRTFRQQSQSLSEFLERISWISSVDELRRMVKEPATE